MFAFAAPSIIGADESLCDAKYADAAATRRRLPNRETCDADLR
ncbi:hypothetical protein PLANPX_5612 [Lacipirellula parvula]|uniref:Uncharacterized protein n=1 Tax=Lacipirellula parvula TaxID=2650471 RepID=A0A5K7XGL6_9BACT|nr:hypothetical protein PLANPX_5612 [Lacipirellula parvula]